MTKFANRAKMSISSTGTGNVTYDNVSLDVSSEDSNPEDLAFSADGTKMFHTGYHSDKIHQYSIG
jgi:hypothetical protein